MSAARIVDAVWIEGDPAHGVHCDTYGDANGGAQDGRDGAQDGHDGAQDGHDGAQDGRHGDHDAHDEPFHGELRARRDESGLLRELRARDFLESMARTRRNSDRQGHLG